MLQNRLSEDDGKRNVAFGNLITVSNHTSAAFNPVWHVPTLFCVCMSVLQLCKHTCVPVCGGQRSEMSGISLHHSPHYFLRQGLSLNPRLAARLDWVSREPQGILLSLFSSSGIMLPCLVFHVGAGDLNSDPHTCGVSTLPDDPNP